MFKNQFSPSEVALSENIIFGSSDLPFIAGPCVLESFDKALFIAESLINELPGLPLIFKASFDKANRSSVDSFRGPGLKNGVEILKEVKRVTGLPICVDFHQPSQAEKVAEVADILQIPAFLCRQTDMILAAADTDSIVNIKKGQFIAPSDIGHIVEKALTRTKKILITERGSSFGYNNLVVDMRSFIQMREWPCGLVFDATHSVQLPGGGKETGGMREMAVPLARAATAVGIDGLFMEVYDVPEKSPSDRTTIYPLKGIGTIYRKLLAFHELSRQWDVQ